MKYLPTYNQCREICDANDNFTFFETKHIVDGFNISIFLYRLAMPALFVGPIKDKPEITAHELRGLTFVFNEDGTIFNRYLLMDKFFNLNQSECSTYTLLKDEKIKEITYKEDGSILSFIKLPNGKAIAKTKGSFEADQAIRAQALYESNPYIKRFVDYCLINNIVAIFEFVGPTNRVVLRYDKTDLVIIKLRNNLTGEYISIKDIPLEIVEGNTLVKTFDDLTLDELIAKCETDKDYEGFVVTFESGKMIKLKLLDYIALHNLHTEDLHREDSIIYLIVEEQIDDIIAQLAEDDERRTIIFDLIDVVNHHIIKECREIQALLDKYQGSKRDFAMAYKNDKHFASAMRNLNQGEDVLKIVKDKILKDTFYLMNARKWIETNKLTNKLTTNGLV